MIARLEHPESIDFSGDSIVLDITPPQDGSDPSRWSARIAPFIRKERLAIQMFLETIALKNGGDCNFADIALKTYWEKI